jgi:hypothetical protein
MHIRTATGLRPARGWAAAGRDGQVAADLSADKSAESFEPMACQGGSQALIDRLPGSVDDE